MKSCPTCNRTFEDNLTFCLADGSLLSAPFDPQATHSISTSRIADQIPTEVMNAAATSSRRPEQPTLVVTDVPPTIASSIQSRGKKPLSAQAFPTRRTVAWQIHLLSMIVGLVVGKLLGNVHFRPFYLIVFITLLAYGSIGGIFGYKWPQMGWKWGVWIVALYLPFVTFMIFPLVALNLYYWWVTLAQLISAPVAACLGSHIGAQLSRKRASRYGY